jgi:hypothetical protein
MDYIEATDKGYFIAAYACPTDDAPAAYVGYAKICRSEPESYFEAEDCLLKDSSGIVKSTPEEAMSLAVHMARLQVRKLPPLEKLPTMYTRRPIHSHERARFGLLW